VCRLADHDSGEQTRQKLKEAYEAEFAATIERAEKQIILAKHGRRLLKLLDDTPVVPGDARPAYPHGQQARQILNDAEDDLRDWRPELDEFSHADHQQIQQHQHGSGEDLRSSPGRSVKGKEKFSEDSTVISPSSVNSGAAAKREGGAKEMTA
jgi:hypothetical protein